MRKKRKIKRAKRTLAEQQTAEERKALIEAAKVRRGVRVDFTSRKLHSRTEETGKVSKIVRCSSCGQKGSLSKALLPSFLVIHRGTIKEDRFNLTEYCVCSQFDFVE